MFKFHVGTLIIYYNTTNVKNMHPHWDSNPGPWTLVTENTYIHTQTQHRLLLHSCKNTNRYIVACIWLID